MFYLQGKFPSLSKSGGVSSLYMSDTLSLNVRAANVLFPLLSPTGLFFQAKYTGGKCVHKTKPQPIDLLEYS